MNIVRNIKALPQVGSLPAFLQVKGYFDSLQLVACSGSFPQVRVAQVLGALLESVPVVLVGSAVRIPDRTVRRLRALMRRSGSVLLAHGGWPGAEVQLRVASAGWEGVGRGHGLLRGRRVTVTAGGRGSAARPRQTELWLPGPDGLVGVVERRAEEALVDERRAGLRVVG
ncbi:hypothetical protein [Streptomyces sp. NPDC002746]